MEKEILNRFEQLLKTQLLELETQDQSADRKLPVDFDDCRDLVDHVTAYKMNWMHANLQSRKLKVADQIRQALKRIREGSFGLCADCGEDVEIRRLEARPTAHLCFHCQGIYEREEGVHAYAGALAS